MTDFAALLRLLEGTHFILVGGVAAAAHGSIRMTVDVDVVYARDDENLARLVERLAPHHPYPRGAPPGLPFQFDVETIRRGLNFTLTTDVGDLDLLGEITGGGVFEELVDHTVTLRVFGQEVRCLDLPTLIRVKRAAGRPKDFDAISELEALEESRERGDA